MIKTRKVFIKLISHYCIIFFLVFLIFSLNSFARAETLDQAFVSMVGSNPVLYESEANQQASWQAYKQLHAGYFPTISLEYNIGRGKGISVSPQTTDIGYTVANIQHRSITLSQLIFDGGALSNRVASARNRFESARLESLLQLNLLALRTTAAYLAVLRSREMTRVAAANVNSHQSSLGKVRRRYQGGAGTISELSLAEARLQEAKLVLDKSKLELENTESIYKQVIGHYPPAQLTVPDEPTHAIPTSLNDIERMAYTNNPAILSAQESIQSARKEVDASKAVLYYPNVSLQLKAFRDNNLNGIESRTVSWQGFLAFTYNLSLGGADLANVRKSAALLSASEANLENKRREIALAIEQTWHELQIARRDTLILRSKIRSNRLMVDAYVKEFFIGRRSMLDIMNSENELYNTQAALIDVRYKAKIDTYALLANAGLLAGYLCDKSGAGAFCREKCYY